MERRLKRLRVSPEIIAEIGKRAVEGKLPEDTETAYVFYENNRGCFSVVLSSQAFEDIEEGHEIPVMEPIIVVRDIFKEEKCRKR